MRSSNDVNNATALQTIQTEATVMEEETIPPEVKEEATVAKLTIDQMIKRTIKMFILVMKQERLP
jgi:hypothetical protein